MIKIKGLDHVVIRAKDSATMCDFYCDVLGCTVERESTAELGLTQLRAGNALTDIVSVASPRIAYWGKTLPEKDMVPGLLMARFWLL